MKQQLIKMTRKEQVKILDDKIKANERQYNLVELMLKYQLILVVTCLNMNI